MELKAELKQPYTEEERCEFISEQNHMLGYEIREVEDGLEAWGKTDEELAPTLQKGLVTSIYQIKANKAYGGVVVNDALIFETNQTSITNTVASIALMNDTATANWKFYTMTGEPYMQQVSKLQLASLAQFGRDMINECFKVEGIFNEKLQEATTEQLNNEEWRKNFITEVQTEMDKVNNKLTVTF